MESSLKIWADHKINGKLLPFLNQLTDFLKYKDQQDRNPKSQSSPDPIHLIWILYKVNFQIGAKLGKIQVICLKTLSTLVMTTIRSLPLKRITSLILMTFMNINPIKCKVKTQIKWTVNIPIKCKVNIHQWLIFNP